MNLKHLLLASLLSIPFNSQAEGLFDNLFYGVALLNQSVDIQVDTGTGSTSNSESGSGIALFADKYYQGTYRFDGNPNAARSQRTSSSPLIFRFPTGKPGCLKYR